MDENGIVIRSLSEEFVYLDTNGTQVTPPTAPTEPPEGWDPPDYPSWEYCKKQREGAVKVYRCAEKGER